MAADEDTPPRNRSDNAPKLTAAQIKERGVSGESVKQALMGTGQMDYVLDAQGNLRMPKNSSTDNSKTNAVEKTEALIAEFREVFESLKDVGLVLEHAGKSSANIRKKLEEAIKASQTQLARVEALKDLGNTYEAKADDVLDIAKAVEDGTKSKLAIMGRNTDGILKDFDDAVKAQRAKAKRGDDEDEDLIITQAGAGGVLLDGISFPNEKCPMSGKKLEDIDEPVADEKGYVYERAAIEDYIRRNGKPEGRGGVGEKVMSCPVAGTSHQVAVSKLKPSREVEKLKRLKARQVGDKRRRSDVEEILSP